jgi:hypothetical protein
MLSVIMTAFITHYLKKNRLDLWVLLVLTSLVCLIPGAVRADVSAAEISVFKAERAGEAILLTAAVKFELPAAVEEALMKGVAIIFVAEVDVYRERWYWKNKKVASAERHLRLAYQPLTRRWRLNIASGVITNSALGISLNQNFDTLADALSALQRQSRWKIAEVSEVELEQKHSIEFNFRLDLAQLPRPLQIGTLGQSDWNISASIIRPLVMEVSR